jgi:hypothetical protein
VEVARPTLATDNEVVLSLVAKAQEMDAAWSIATKLADTAFVPRSYRGKVAETAAAIITGNELGLPLMAALRSIDVIEGTPALRAVTLRALVLKAGHEIWTEESNQHRAIVKGRRAGTDKVESSTWDAERARVANLSSKDNYQRHPGNMYLARATADVVRLVAPDAILGLPYSAEEAADEPFDRDESETPTAPKRTTRAARKPLPERAPAPEPELDDEAGEKPSESPAVAASERGAAKAEARAEGRGEPYPDEDPSAGARRLQAEDDEAEERRLAEEALAEEARLNAAAAFADGPEGDETPLALSSEPDIDWGVDR